MISYTVGDATRPLLGKPPYIICHVCNDIGKWGAGFTAALDNRWRGPREAYLKAFSSRPDLAALGACSVCLVHTEGEPKVPILVVNMVAQHGVRGPDNRRPLQYPELCSCLLHVRKLAIAGKGWSVHMPRIGCGLGGATWGMVGPLVEGCLDGLEVFVYDLI